MKFISNNRPTQKGLPANISKEISAGFAIVEIILIISIVAIAAGTGLYVINSNKQTNKSLDAASKTPKVSTSASKIASFDECKKAKNSKILLTYPEACVTKDGKSFTDTVATTLKYLTIKEWGVKFPLSKNIEDAYYTASKNGQYFNLRVHSLDGEADCTNTDLSVSTIMRATLSEYNQSQSSGGPVPADSPKIGNYYYYILHAQYGCAENRSLDDLVLNVEKTFTDAATKIQAD